MKFINYLKSIAGVEIFPLIGLVIFVVFFTAVAVWVIGADKKRMQDNGNLPLQS
ncbi:MAG: CcoQ/FixQ family Cbb3-type cytochrome c oxidase assembly chaperone [Chitinophagaceae bacterium]|jgi:cytochrome c oxidase cbb3-type subunit 3|nr:CcoQ/FixQ family Cbb3-type cytochrome c oxidase assembly chaperone [Chitinophagaceae bacterium]